ncbi:hypothetical protein GJAV_G00192530 [Gymnothorax javanicus]|nr:hypothetical protein GJAV_G00192530 [Gymnothorax javanicus]
MEGQHPVSESKNMDNCLRRLKQELLSMKEAGDGLHAQMNSMMGALQELKLLQSCEQALPAARQVQKHRQSLDTTPTSSPDSSSFPLPRRSSRVVSPPRQQDRSQPGFVQPLDLTSILHRLSREGPSLDSKCPQDHEDDSSDWTSSLLSCCRNRQPLVLGDNVFADLVGNWLDLPELEEPGSAETGGGAREGSRIGDEPAHPLRLSRSQEICRKFSLTANIFRKFLRSVRPDRDKLLKEKPGWMPPDDNEAQLCKRPKKAAKPKGTFYLPFRTGGAGGQGNHGKGRPSAVLPEDKTQLSGVYIGRVNSDFGEITTPMFDYTTAVWV